MKTSNRLLIAFGALLFLAPLLGMVVVSKVYYKDMPEMAQIQEANNQPFETASKGRKAIALDKPFSAITFPDGKRNSVEIHINRSTNYGIKIPKELIGSIKAEVINGVLNINFDKKRSDYEQRIFIIVYAPNLEKLSANNFVNLNCVTRADSMTINVTKTYFDIGNSDIVSTAVLDNGDTLSHRVYNQTNVKSLNVMANNSKINILGTNLNTLNVSVANDSEINLDGTVLDKGNAKIAQLMLKTVGKNQVSIKNFDIKNGEANFSDSTQLNISTPLLKLLLKN